MSPDLSIVVCTRNRERSLARCLGSLAALRRPFALEVIVVDNGSEDATAATVSRLANEHEWLRCVAEPRLGLSRARNRGAEAALAPLLVYLDDDAEPDCGWAEALRHAFAETDAAVVGGPILPRFESAAPQTVTATHLGAWSCQDLGSKRRTVTEFPYLFGANLAIRRDHLERLGGFDEAFGRRGHSLLSGEDTDFCERALAAGCQLVYEPQAIVHHWIPPERVSAAYLRRRAFATGRTRALQMRRRCDARQRATTLAGKALKLPAHLALWGGAAALGRHAAAAEREWSVFATLGMLCESLRAQRIDS